MSASLTDQAHQDGVDIGKQQLVQVLINGPTGDEEVAQLANQPDKGCCSKSKAPMYSPAPEGAQAEGLGAMHEEVGDGSQGAKQHCTALSLIDPKPFTCYCPPACEQFEGLACHRKGRL